MFFLMGIQYAMLKYTPPHYLFCNFAGWDTQFTCMHNGHGQKQNITLETNIGSLFNFFSLALTII